MKAKNFIDYVVCKIDLYYLDLFLNKMLQTVLTRSEFPRILNV